MKSIIDEIVIDLIFKIINNGCLHCIVVIY